MPADLDVLFKASISLNPSSYPIITTTDILNTGDQFSINSDRKMSGKKGREGKVD